MIRFFSLLLLLTIHEKACAQTPKPFRVMFYNVENFFDVIDNPATDDDEFTPKGPRHWHYGRYYHKLRQISKVITAAGEWDTPAIVGLCEIENDSILDHLTRRTPLRRQEYQYLSAETNDPRGTRVALLYQRDRFRYLHHESHAIRFSRKKHKETRHILHVAGLIAPSDTLDLFVIHFPSRYGGEKESEKDRMDAATTLRSLADSIISRRQTARLIIMGDFNDTPQDKSLKNILTHPKGLTNLFASRNDLQPPGTHKYQGRWSQLDQIIINDDLLSKDTTFRFLKGSALIFQPRFLFTNDKTWRGQRPFRTYHGYRYEGGFSDHLPIIADFIVGSFLPEEHSEN